MIKHLCLMFVFRNEPQVQRFQQDHHRGWNVGEGTDVSIDCPLDTNPHSQTTLQITKTNKFFRTSPLYNHKYLTFILTPLTHWRSSTEEYKWNLRTAPLSLVSLDNNYIENRFVLCGVPNVRFNTVRNFRPWY